MIDLPPQLILPDHYVAKRPAIIRAHEGDADGLRAMDRERGIRAILPGMVPVVAAVQLSVSLIYNDGAYPASSMSMPGGISAGDFCVYLNWSTNFSGGAPANVLPSGFSTGLTGDSSSGGGARCSCHYKILNGSETTVPGMTGAANSRIQLLIFRPNRSIQSVSIVQATGQSTSNDPSQQTLSLAGEAPPLIGIGMAAGDGAMTWSNSAGMTTIDTQAGRYGGAYVLYNPGDTPTNQTIDMSDSGAFNRLQRVIFRLS